MGPKGTRELVEAHPNAAPQFLWVRSQAPLLSTVPPVWLNQRREAAARVCCAAYTSTALKGTLLLGPCLADLDAVYSQRLADPNCLHAKVEVAARILVISEGRSAWFRLLTPSGH